MQDMISGILFEMAVDVSFFFSFLPFFFLFGTKYGYRLSVLECDLVGVGTFIPMYEPCLWMEYEHCKVYDRRW